MRVEKKPKAFAYKIYSHFTQQCGFFIWPSKNLYKSCQKTADYHKQFTTHYNRNYRLMKGCLQLLIALKKGKNDLQLISQRWVFGAVTRFGLSLFFHPLSSYYILCTVSKAKNREVKARQILKHVLLESFGRVKKSWWNL